MATIVDYASLKQAITDWAHRADMVSGNYADYFIQNALEQIQDDIFEANFGNGIRYMEAAYAPSAITGGTLPVPTDWIAPKVFKVSDGSSDQFTLIFKSAAWITDNYPIRQPMGLPAYIARDVMPSASFTASLNTSGVLAVSAISSGLLFPGMVLDDGAGGLPNPNPGTAVMITGQTSGTSGSTGNYTAASCSPLAPTYTIGSESMTGGGNVFIFGPYPDSSYQVSGTYYQQIPALSAGNTTNWVVLNAPMMLHAACMKEAGKFLKNTTMMQLWDAEYQPRLKKLVDRDKAERWAAATMQVELG